jgi:hypothetical protein
MSLPSSRCERCGAEMLPAMIRCRNCDWRRTVSSEPATRVIQRQRSPDASTDDDPQIERLARELEELSDGGQPLVPASECSSAGSTSAGGASHADGATLSCTVDIPGERRGRSMPPRRRPTSGPYTQDSNPGSLLQAIEDAEQELTEPSPSRWTWRDLIPDVIYGLASDRTLAIVGAVIVGLGVIAGGIWWGPFSNADVVEPTPSVSPGAVRGYIASLAIAENGTLAAGRTHGQVEIWDTTAQQRIETLSSVRGMHVAISRDGSQLLTGDEQQSCLVELASDSVTVRDGGIRSITANAAGTHALSLGTQLDVLIWNLVARDPPARRPLATQNVSAIALSHDGQHFALGTPTGRIQVVDVNRVRVVRKIAIDGSGAITALALDAAGDRIAAITADNRLHVFNGQVYDKKWGPPLVPDIKFVSKVHWLNEGQILIAGGRELAISTLHEKPQTWNAEVHSVDALAISPDGRMAAVGCRDEPAIVLFDLTTRQRSGILDIDEE